MLGFIQTGNTKTKKTREYEQKYLSRYKQPKTKKNVGSDLYKPEIPKPKRDMRKERKEYEQKYLSRYKQPKTKKNASSEFIQTGNTKTKTDMKKRTQGIRAEISFTIQGTKDKEKCWF